MIDALRLIMLAAYVIIKLRCSWSIACQCCSNYIFILDLTHGFNRLCKGNCKTRWEKIKFRDLVCHILEIWQYMSFGYLFHFGIRMVPIGQQAIHTLRSEQMVDILHTTFSKAFSWKKKKMIEFWLKFPKGLIDNKSALFRWWLGTKHLKSHYWSQP